MKYKVYTKWIGYSEIEVCDCKNEYDAIDHATDLIDLGNIEFEAEEVSDD